MTTCNQITLATKDLVPGNLWLLTKCLESMKIQPEKVSIKRETLSLVSLTSKRSRFWINSMLIRYNGNRSRRITSKNLSFYLNKSKPRKLWRENLENGILITLHFSLVQTTSPTRFSITKRRTIPKHSTTKAEGIMNIQDDYSCWQSCPYNLT